MCDRNEEAVAEIRQRCRWTTWLTKHQSTDDRQHDLSLRRTPVALGLNVTVFTLYSRLYNRLGELCAAKRRLSGPARTLAVIRLTCSKSAVWTVDDVARSVEFFLTCYFFYFTLGSIWPRGMTKTRPITKLYFTPFFYFYIWIFETFRPAGCRPITSCTTGCRV